jgi:hypothetical protein
MVLATAGSFPQPDAISWYFVGHACGQGSLCTDSRKARILPMASSLSAAFHGGMPLVGRPSVTVARC